MEGTSQAIVLDEVQEVVKRRIGPDASINLAVSKNSQFNKIKLIFPPPDGVGGQGHLCQRRERKSVTNKLCTMCPCVHPEFNMIINDY